MIEESTRTYTLSDAELAMFTSNLVVFMNRDSVEFDAKGIDAAAITALEALGNAFEVFPNDAYYRADVALAVDRKNAHRDSLENKIRAIVGCAKIKWGDSSPYVKRFDVGKMTREDDKRFLTTARQTVIVASSYLAALTDQGLTQAMIDSLGSEAQSMEDEMNNIAEKEAVRDIKTQERVDNGNELYGFVVRYCEIGKIIWQDIDEAKYNDYVIYKTEGGLPGKVLNLGYDYGTGIVSWDVPQSPDPIDKYELERSTDGDNWTVVYEGAENEALVPLLSGANYFRCRAHNKNGWGSWSDTLEVNVGGIPAPDWVNAVYSGVPPGSKVTAEQVEVTWANVATATMYEVWRSVVNVNDPAGDFTMIGEVDKKMYLDFDLTKNKRNYYYIIAKNDTDRSEPSDVAFADVVD